MPTSEKHSNNDRARKSQLVHIIKSNNHHKKIPLSGQRGERTAMVIHRGTSPAFCESQYNIDADPCDYSNHNMRVLQNKT